MPPQSPRRVGFYVVGLILLLFLPLIFWWQRQNIYDWWRLRNYDPPQRIIQLADNTTMTPYGRKLFYVHYPILDDKSSFNEHCESTERSLVLGCYTGYHGIYILDVQDERLQGIHEVTAAHEMLHAAYDRLSSGERERINRLVEDFFAKLENPRIQRTIDQYRSQDPSVVPNELHSILATEVRSLNPELEDYYRQYFDNRARLVDFTEQYEKVFTELKARVEQYDAELADLRKQIEAAENNLTSQEQALNTERARLEALLAANRREEYNSSVAGFNERVRRYNSDLAAAKRLIERYNTLVTERNKIALEEQELIEAIDSRISPQSPR